MCIHSFQLRDMLGDLEGRKLLAIAAHIVETQQKPVNLPSHVSLDHLSAKEKERYGHKRQVSASNKTTKLFNAS